MSDMEVAIPTRIDGVDAGLLGAKLRVAGQVLAYDARTGLALLRSGSGGAGLLVDVAHCVSSWSKTWLGERLCSVIAVGYLERAPDGTVVPAGPKHVVAPRVDGQVVLRALLVSARPDLLGGLWGLGVEMDNNNRFPLSDVRGDPLLPPRTQPTTATPPSPSSSYTWSSVEHPSVLPFLNHLAWVARFGFHHYIHPHPTVFALTALSVLSCPADPAHVFFWSLDRRRATAKSVQAVIDSGARLVIPVFWPGIDGVLALLAAREARAAAATTNQLKRKAGGAKGEPPQKVQRVTRASVRQQQPPSHPPAAPDTGSNATPPERGRRPPPTSTPQRASARQMQKKEEAVSPVSPAVVPPPPPTRPAHTRARSTSSETAVASSSSRGVSVLSADTIVVDVSVSGGGDKGVGVLIAPTPIASGRMVTRSRKTKPSAKPCPATKPTVNKSAGAAGGRRAPTGKRKVAKSKMPA
ncbi:hypothetical protein DFH07DRAFT_765072 [Mycena maculata]|uniref:Uncharacterized protein n=1 Tax=Mycena maculata TaxID=230809 RepID=A0AAD7NYQ1_9AGAR|nr:hypothetical protein DFH07DRAFT_765072 [Mycena maculata]